MAVTLKDKASGKNITVSDKMAGILLTNPKRYETTKELPKVEKKVAKKSTKKPINK